MRSIVPHTTFPQLAATAPAQLDAARERIRQYALVESPSDDPEALARCAELIESGHADIGARTVREGGAAQHLVSTWPAQADAPGAGHLLILGHYDTVWPVGQLEVMPYVDDGERIAGPGTFDMKGGLVVVERALDTLSGLGVPRAREIRFVVVADEEIGSPDGRAVVERHADGAAAVLGLEPPHPRGVLKTGRRGSTRVQISVTGRQAHAALDRSKGISAIDELLDQLALVRTELPEDGSTLVNIGTIEGGSRANVIPGSATAEIGLRFTELDTERRVLDWFRGLRPIRDGAQVEVTVLSNRPAWSAPDDNPLLDAVADAGANLGFTVEGRPAAGAGDTNFTGAAGVPTLDGFGPIGRGAHAPEESLVIASLPERIGLLAAIMAGAV